MVGFLVVVLAQPANPYFETARAAHRAFDYGKCLKSADLASRLEAAPARKAEIELLWGLCAFELGRRAEALDHFEVALRLDPAVQLPEVVSPKIAAGFETVRKRLPPPPPTVEPVVPPLTPSATPAPDAVVATTPERTPRPSRGWALTFSALALATAVGAIVTGQLAVASSTRAQRAVTGFDVGVANQDARGFALASNVLTLLAGVLAVPAAVAWVVSLW